MKLEDELKLYGSEMDAAEFEDVIQELHAVMHPMWSFEQLLYEPRHELRYCEAVRARAGQGLPDNMILRRLNNIRKKGLRGEAARN
jgi:hypothetical protein